MQDLAPGEGAEEGEVINTSAGLGEKERERKVYIRYTVVAGPPVQEIKCIPFHKLQFCFCIIYRVGGWLMGRAGLRQRQALLHTTANTGTNSEP